MPPMLLALMESKKQEPTEFKKNEAIFLQWLAAPRIASTSPVKGNSLNL